MDEAASGMWSVVAEPERWWRPFHAAPAMDRRGPATFAQVEVTPGSTFAGLRHHAFLLGREMDSAISAKVRALWSGV